MVPAETDFVIYERYQYNSSKLRNTPLPGLDFAYYKNGYVYHSLIDDIKHVETGQLQSLGDNLLPFIKEICNSDELSKDIIESESRGLVKSPLFFDIFTKYFFVVERYILFSIFGILSLITIKIVYSRQNICLKMLKMLIKATIIGFLCVLLMMIIEIYILSKPMSWYSNIWLSILLYSPPFLLSFVNVINNDIKKLEKLYSSRIIESNIYFSIVLLYMIISIGFTITNTGIFYYF